MGYVTKMYAWRGRDVAQLVEYGVQHAADTDLTPWCSMGFFCQSLLSVQTLFRCLNSPHVQSHALTSVHRLKILSLGSHTIIWTQKNTAHTLGHPSKMESGSPNGKRTVVSLHVGFHWGGTEAREQLHAQFLSLKKNNNPKTRCTASIKGGKKKKNTTGQLIVILFRNMLGRNCTSCTNSLAKKEFILGLSSVQDSIYKPGKAHIPLYPISQEFLHCCLLNSLNVCLSDNSLFSFFDWRSSSSSSFYTCFHQAISGVTSLALSLEVVSQASQHWYFPKHKPLV